MRSLLLAFALMLVLTPPGRGTDFFVAPSGNDKNAGAREAPFATLKHACDEARSAPRPVFIHLGDGVYYLPETLELSAEDSGETWQAVDGAKPVISGGAKLELQWKPYKGGIMQAGVPADVETEELFVNGERQILVRYPNYDPGAQYFDGYAADAISKERVARWADPAGGYVHAMHPALWGDFTWLITGKNADGQLTMVGGWQNNRGGSMHQTIRFVENIFEELDAPGEWFLNRKTHVLYFYPPAGLDLDSAKIEVTRLNTLVALRGSEHKPVRSISLKGLTFRQANRTVMETREPLLRSDWAIDRSGAIVFNRAENCSLEDSLIDQVGGNAVFVNNYNRHITIQGCEIVKAGASGIVFLGDPGAARNPLFNYNQRQEYAAIDKTPGPKTDNYPSDCLVDDCLIHLTGRVEKQTAGVAIDLARNITVRHCSIYDMPRAGINIGDGCWGGNVIEYCDIFDTVKETGDHGSFNSWGRDRYWGLNNAPQGELAQLSLLDAVEPNILRNSRWRCDHGWDIDLDDGSSNYEIYNNLCLNGGIKLREGFHRKVANNITVNNTFYPHVWFKDSEDEVYSNIFMEPYRGVDVPGANAKGKLVDRNLFYVKDAATKDRNIAFGWDLHSIVGNPLFIDPPKGNFDVAPGSPALGIGFVNFPMDRFGVQKPSLREIARTPAIPALHIDTAVLPPEQKAASLPRHWLGATLHALQGEEYSAFGVAKDEGGVQLKEVPDSSAAAQAGLKKDDVIQKLNGWKVSGMDDFFAALLAARDAPEKVTLVRAQKLQTLALKQIVPHPDDVPAFPAPPDGFDVRRDNIPHGHLDLVEYDSKIVGTRRRMNVYTPPGYSTKRKYPVLYLLHGIAGNEWEWVGYCKADILLDNLLADGKAVPMIVVMPNGRAQKNDHPEGDPFKAAPAFAVFEHDLLDDVIPAIDSRYSTYPGREHRALAGLSMGGGQALNFGLGHLDTFAWVGAFSAAPNTKEPADLLPDPAAAKQLKLLWLSCGNEDNLIHVSQGVHACLVEKNVPHIWHVTSHRHDAEEWKQAFYYFAQKLFK